MNVPLQDNCGFWYYKELPEGSIPVTIEMFNNGILSRTATPYMIYSTIYDQYQCYRVNDTTHNTIIPFVESNRVYLLPANNSILKPQEDIQPINTVFELEI